MDSKPWVVLNADTDISYGRYETEGEANKVAAEMTAYHERKYSVRHMPRTQKDCLGRPAPLPEPTTSADPVASRVLSESAMDAIAEDVRRKPLAEVGRHVMPLLHHIIGLDARCCRDCINWVPYNRASDLAFEGECCDEKCKSLARAIYDEGQSSRVSVAMVTPFDWCCSSFRLRPAALSGDEPQGMRA